MLVTLQQVLAVAQSRGIAVGAFNTQNLESLRAVLGAAEAQELPVIVQFAQCREGWTPLSVMGPIMVALAQQAPVPVCVHLDHGETLEYLHRALDLGFTGIMFDGSRETYEKNLEDTCRAVELARHYGAGVEAELGCMGRRESGAGEHSGIEDETKIYTDPVLARKFVRDTGIDALACSFGTTHGIYLTQPKLDFDVVRQVRTQTGGIPVVMHGGSGVCREDYHRAVQAGVRKINYFTYMDKAGGTGAGEYLAARGPKEPLFYSGIVLAAKQAMQENVTRAMRTFALLDE